MADMRSKLISGLEDYIGMMQEDLDDLPDKQKKYPKIDESCKYSPLKCPMPCVSLNNDEVVLSMDGNYSYATHKQRVVLLMNYRFRSYLMKEFIDGKTVVSNRHTVAIRKVLSDPNLQGGT